MRQKNASPTRAQSRILEQNGLKPRDWSVVRELRKGMIVRCRRTGKVFRISESTASR